MSWIAPLLALTVMEVVLGIDNIVFLSVTTDRLPPERQPLARRLGLLGALVARVSLLFTLGFLMRLEAPLFRLSALGIPEAWIRTTSVDGVSTKDLILLAGGVFLLAKTVREIQRILEPTEVPSKAAPHRANMLAVVVQIALLDLVFSIDSVLSAVAMARELWIMIAATAVAIAMMAAFAEPVARFVHAHPTVKMLALSYLILVSVMLLADGLGTSIPKGYVYFAMGFSFFVEFMNGRVARKRARTHASAAAHAADPRSPDAIAFRGYGFESGEGDVVAGPTNVR